MIQHPVNPRPSQIQRTHRQQFVSPVVPAANNLMAFNIGRTGSRKRPIDKAIVFINKNAIDATQVSTVLFTATFPCTVVGLRWNINASQDAGTAFCAGAWCIIIAREGITVNTIARTDGATLFAPEQDVLTWGQWGIDNNTQTKDDIGSTKTMRKLMGGDRLIWIGKGVATETTHINGVVQFFCKT